jgi:ketosteroid isomerase-like protein
VSRRESLRLALAWLSALGEGDADRFVDLLTDDVVWRGVPSNARCDGRDDVIEMLRGQISAGLPDARALELVASDDGAVIVGYRAADLTAVDDTPLPGQVFNVFLLRDGRIASIQDFATRGEALSAAGAAEPGWV